MAAPFTLQVLFLFEGAIDKLVVEASQVLGHLPAFWDVSEDERAWVSAMFEKPLRQGQRSLLYEGQASAETVERLHMVVAEVGTRSDGKKVLLSNGAPIVCSFALGGSADEVRVASERMTADPVEYNRRLRAIPAIQASQDRAVRLFGELAEEAIRDGNFFDVDWRSIETRYILATEGALPADKVFEVLLDHSPGTTSALRRASLASDLSSVRAPAAQRTNEPAAGPGR